jgi:hypothetical protein
MGLQVLRYGIAAGVTVTLLAGAGAHADGLEAGMWRVINKPEINGQTAPEAQNMRCLSPDDVSDLGRTFSRSAGPPTRPASGSNTNQPRSG